MAQKRETIEPHSKDKRYVRRDEHGRFTSDQVDTGKSLSAEAHQGHRARTTVKSGQGDKGDQKR